MFQHLVVPVDLSTASFRAVPIAAEMVARVGGRVDVVNVVDRLADVPLARDALALGMTALGALPVPVRQLVLTGPTPSVALDRHLAENPGTLVAMSSHGHGRSAAVLGSTVDEVLRATYGPVIVFGPHVTSGRVDGTYVVPLDGSDRAASVLPIVGAWAVEFHATAWLVEVLDQDPPPAGSGLVESSVVRRRAERLAQVSGVDVEFEVLHGPHAAREVIRFAESQNASLIFMTTHGRTGFDRLAAGSIAADTIRHAHVPIVLYRPPELASAPEHAPAHGTPRVRDLPRRSPAAGRQITTSG